MAVGKKIAVKNLLPDDLSIFCDSNMLTTVFRNLISNSIKFTNEGGVEFGYQLVENKIQFFVKDTGIGIESDFLERIFIKFAQADTQIQAKYGGTGLGIPISQGFVQLLGGELWVESTLNEGSTFYFTIPYHHSEN
jgi:signal transduction histidine kinase